MENIKPYVGYAINPWATIVSDDDSLSRASDLPSDLHALRNCDIAKSSSSDMAGIRRAVTSVRSEFRLWSVGGD